MLNQQTIEKLYTMRMRGMADAFTQQQEDPKPRSSASRNASHCWWTPVELAARPGVGEAPQRGSSARSSVHRRHRFPRDARSGQTGGSSADPRLGLDPTPPTYLPGGSDRDRENVPGAGLRAEGMSRWVHGLLRHCRTVVPGTRAGAGRRQLCQELRALGQVDALIVDDWAMAPLADAERRAFLEICDERYLTKSTLLTSQLPVAKWHAQIGDPTVADSILDRLVHAAHRIELQGESMRKKRGGRGAKEGE